MINFEPKTIHFLNYNDNFNVAESMSSLLERGFESDKSIPFGTFLPYSKSLLIMTVLENRRSQQDRFSVRVASSEEEVDADEIYQLAKSQTNQTSTLICLPIEVWAQVFEFLSSAGVKPLSSHLAPDSSSISYSADDILTQFDKNLSALKISSIEAMEIPYVLH